MYQLCLSVKPRSEVKNRWVLSRRLHGFILRMIKMQDPQLSEWLHNRKDRQFFSCHSSFQEKEWYIQTPSREIVRCLQQSFLSHPIIDLRDWTGEIQEIHCYSYTVKDMLQNFSPKVTFQFHTPTTFYQWGNYYPMPELQRLFASGAKSYEMDGNIPIPWEEIEPLTRKIRIEHLSITTQRADFGKFKVVGFCGTLAFSLKALSVEEQKKMWLLANYGSLMGFGYKTAWGLGQTSIREQLLTPPASESTQGVLGKGNPSETQGVPTWRENDSER